ncbi:MAG: 4Fe-4S dicluster domain-containing protein [Gammaproteobacteria bacterium]|nr:4Fe-4S dicluster domain-containing protein [Rhodocyclaceae bacterium]MBU3909645.1 4Fe-4S dicluster domain-containing protein [Gammaproteobacteria bacterium]MBU3987960.1 4Fe-4S dicluster domain-containing protein [Gammaproteobacteria bacterium]MBU4005178.1 4Fe-4S dicluster domain-containing protein [Gammaproteobacteria bacterium]MBU4022357.1 4Fe-4S dicluster domain-containing protein [Gammaproteobacteria bacterium]
MAAVAALAPAPSQSRLLLSGNEAVARAVWESGCKVAAAYPGTPSTEILEALCTYPDIYTEWSVNEKVSMEVALGASMMGARSFCAMKHVGLNVAADPLMTLTLTGVVGGMVIAVADDVGMASSQNEQDSRFYARFAHLPVFEPADSQEAYDMVLTAFELSEQHQVPVILRLTARICHVKCVATVGERVPHEPSGFVKNAERWVMVPSHAKRRIPLMFERDAVLREVSEHSPLNILEPGKDRRVGFVTSGPAYMHVREAFPDAPVLKLGMSHPLPLEKVRALADMVDTLVVVEEVEPVVENELRAAGFSVRGKDILPKIGELAPEVLTPAINRLLNNEPPPPPVAAPAVFPRPPTLCASCPHMGIYYTLSQLKNIIVAGDIGCYTLGAGHPWNALDTTICMGAAVTVAHGMDKGRGAVDKNKKILAVMGDSTFMHMGMQGLLDATYNNSNITFLLLDNGTVGMTGGQNTPANGLDIRGNPAPRIDFRKLVEALGVKPERVREVDPYEMPNLFKVIREETKIEEVSVILAYRPCVLTDEFKAARAYHVDDDKCTGCGNCIDVGCPAIHVTHREKVVKPSGKEVELAFVRIDPIACTGCAMCLKPCAPDAIVQVAGPRIVAKLRPV